LSSITVAHRAHKAAYRAHARIAGAQQGYFVGQIEIVVLNGGAGQ
jgi:hypothetical protein